MATFWVALGAIVAALIAVGGLVFHLIRYSYQQGVRDERMRAVEERLGKVETRPHADSTEMAVLATRFDGFERLFGALERKIEDVALDVKNILSGKVQPARRTTAGA